MEKSVRNEREQKILNFNTFKRTLEDYADTVKEHNPDLAFSINSAVCRQGENDLIFLEVNNSSEEHTLNHGKQKILSFVKEKTGFDKVVLQVVCKQQETKPKLYRPDETYEYFKKKNPAIEKLVKVFDCEFEH